MSANKVIPLYPKEECTSGLAPSVTNSKEYLFKEISPKIERKSLWIKH